MRAMAPVIEAAIAGVLEPVNGRRTDMVPWQQHQLEWREEVGDVFEAEIDDMLVQAKPKPMSEVFSVNVDGEIQTTTAAKSND
jgi:hypothetical protein